MLKPLQMHSPRFAGNRIPIPNDDEAATGGALGMGVAFTIVGILIAVLIFGSVAPSISTGLNNTENAFAHVTGVSGIIDVVPILLVVGVLFAVAYAGWRKMS